MFCVELNRLRRQKILIYLRPLISHLLYRYVIISAFVHINAQFPFTCPPCEALIAWLNSTCPPCEALIAWLNSTCKHVRLWSHGLIPHVLHVRLWSHGFHMSSMCDRMASTCLPLNVQLWSHGFLMSSMWGFDHMAFTSPPCEAFIAWLPHVLQVRLWSNGFLMSSMWGIDRMACSTHLHNCKFFSSKRTSHLSRNLLMFSCVVQFHFLLRCFHKKSQCIKSDVI